MPPTLPSKLVNTISSHSGPINALTFSSLGGTYILTGSSDRQIHLSRTEPASSSTSSSSSSSTTISTAPIQKYSAHGYAVLSLCCASDNQTFASGGGDRSVFLWDVEKGITTRRFGSNSSQGHTARVTCVAFAAGGQDDNGGGEALLISGSDDRSVRIWDIKARNSNNPIMVLDEAKDGVACLAVVPPKASSAAEFLVGSVDGRLRSYDVRMGRVTVDTFAGPITSVGVTRDGKVGLVSCLDGKIRLMDRRDGVCLQTFPKFNEAPKLLADVGDKKKSEKDHSAIGYVNKDLRLKSCFGAGEALVLAGSEADGKVRAWDILTGDQVGEVSASEKVVSVVGWRGGKSTTTADERGGNVWASGGADGLVRVWGRE